VAFRKGHYHQGQFVPKNPSKYVGNVHNITYRSGWEKKAMVFFDDNPSVLKWGSEELVVPYISPIDNKPHRYFPDFVVVTKSLNGMINRYMVEVKPKAQCSPPVMKARKTKRLVEEIMTYEVNQAKWNAAKAWCSQHDMQFLVLTEHHLGIKR